jgi:hypothetical protein
VESYLRAVITFSELPSLALPRWRVAEDHDRVDRVDVVVMRYLDTIRNQEIFINDGKIVKRINSESIFIKSFRPYVK